MSSERPPASSASLTLDQILADLKHLDITDYVQHDSPKTSVARGGFGEIYKGRYRREDGSEVTVAIKCLTVYLDSSRDTLKIFRRETRAWSRLDHPNVLPLLGYFVEAAGNQSLTFLHLFLNGWITGILNFVKQLPLIDPKRLVFGMAKGLAYLHEQDIVHSDFKAANVLVSSSGDAVICDFGSAHASHDVEVGFVSSDASDLRGTSRWLAYELLTDADRFPSATKESDTWAFGMTVYEIITNGYPFAHILNDAHVLISIMTLKLPSCPETITSRNKKELWDVCAACWEIDPFRRPNMTILVERLTPSQDGPEEFGEAGLLYDGVGFDDFAGFFSFAEDVDSAESVDFAVVDDAMVPPCREESSLADRRSGSPVLPDDLSRIQPSSVEISAAAYKHDEVADYYTGYYLGNRVTIIKSIRDLWEKSQILNSQLELSSAIKQHANVQTALGYLESEWCKSWSFAEEFVLSHCGEEDLSDYVKSHPLCNIIHLILGVAEGLAHIHDHDIVHADIRSSNVFVNGHGQPVITGFTCSRMLPCDAGERQIQGSLRWMAPEVVNAESDDPMIITKKRDVWAFGMTIYELLTGDVPYGNLKYDPQVVLAIADGQRPICPPNFGSWSQIQQALWSVCLVSWNTELAARPPTKELVGSLKGLAALEGLLA